VSLSLRVIGLLLLLGVCTPAQDVSDSVKVVDMSKIDLPQPASSLPPIVQSDSGQSVIETTHEIRDTTTENAPFVNTPFRRVSGEEKKSVSSDSNQVIKDVINPETKVDSSEMAAQPDSAAPHVFEKLIPETSKQRRYRYLLAPSSWGIGKGIGEFSVKELVYTNLYYGLTDKLTMQVGSIIPAWLADDGYNLLLGMNYGKVWDTGIGIHGGLYGVALGKETLLLIPFVGSSFITPKIQLTANYSAFNVSSGSRLIQILNLSGMLFVTPSLALVGECYFTTQEYDDYEDDEERQHYVISSMNLRFQKNKFMIDGGFYLIDKLDIPIPWLDLSFVF